MNYTEHTYGPSELAYKYFLRPSAESALRSLSYSTNSKILDAGCGPGTSFESILKAAGKNSSIVGLDGSTDHLLLAEQQIIRLNAEERIRLVKHDLFYPLPFETGSFDIVYVSDVLFPDDTGDQTLEMIREFKRVLKPGGQLAIFYSNWLRLQILPGYSRLEHLISIANELSKSPGEDWPSSLHPENAINWLRSQSFSDVNISFHETVYQAPLDSKIKDYLNWHLKHIYKKALHFRRSDFEVGKTLIDLFDQLVDVHSGCYLLDNPGYYCRVAASLVTGRK